MGGITRDDTTTEILHQLNSRFAPGAPLREMVAIQKEFGLYSDKYSLRQAARLTNVVPSDITERHRWFAYLDLLKTYPSDQAGVNGHDRVVRARKQNLESDAPLPMYVKTHLAADDDRVTVNIGRPVPHETQEYVIISIPIIPSAGRHRASRIAERARRVPASVGA